MVELVDAPDSKKRAGELLKLAKELVVSNDVRP